MNGEIYTGWFCEDCQRKFEAPKILVDREPGGFFHYCPFCNGDAIYPRMTCYGCGGDFSESLILHGLCPQCRGRAVRRFGTTMRRFTERERGWLYDVVMASGGIVPRELEEWVDE